MSRELRPRTARSYASFAGYEDEHEGKDGAGPSQALLAALDAEADSGSDFAPEKTADAQADHGEEEEEEEEKEDSLSEDDVVADPGDDGLVALTTVTSKSQTAAKSTGNRKGKGKAKAQRIGPDVVVPVLGHGAGLSRTSKRQMYVLPTPSVHHRHRAVPLFSRIGRVERLSSPPILFGPSTTVPTNNFTHSAQVTDRVNKAWGYNVGAGPLWEMVEDRGWFKEAESGGDMETEATRRPRVHRQLGVKAGWQVLNIEYVHPVARIPRINLYPPLNVARFVSYSDAAPYLPTDIVTTDEGNLKPPPPVPCSFGPYGAQTRLEMQMFDSFKMC